jgi:hypothetical protein
MTRLDKEWAIGEIDAFLYATDQIVPDMSGSGITYFGTVQRSSETEAAQHAHVVEQILDRVIPTWSSNHKPSSDREWQHLREWAARARTVLQREEELRERLRDGAPDMDASRLHPLGLGKRSFLLAHWPFLPSRDASGYPSERRDAGKSWPDGRLGDRPVQQVF